jgi:hypothetical protein
VPNAAAIATTIIATNRNTAVRDVHDRLPDFPGRAVDVGSTGGREADTQASSTLPAAETRN